MTFESKNWNSLPEESRFWCFSARYPFDDSKHDFLKNALNELCWTWKAHDQPIKAGFRVIEKRAIAICVDESSAIASGCSIDSRMGLLKKISLELKVDIFDRFHIHVRENSSSKWSSISLKVAKTMESGEFINTVANKKGDWNPISKIKGSWLCP